MDVGTFFDMSIRHMVCLPCGLLLLVFFQFMLEVLEPALGNIACLKALKVLFCVFFRNLYCFSVHIYITSSFEVGVVSHELQVASVFQRPRTAATRSCVSAARALLRPVEDPPLLLVINLLFSVCFPSVRLCFDVC